MRFRSSWIFLPVLGWLTVNIVATPCNIAPTVTPEPVFVDVGKPLIVDALATASDPDGQALAVSILSTTCAPQVSAAVGPTQTITLATNTGAPPCEIRFQVDDGAGGVAVADLDVTIDPNGIFVDGFELGTTNAWSDVVQ